MRTTQDKYKLLEEQIIGKAHWGAEAAEISAFLSEKHGISGAEADRLIQKALSARVAAIRKRAMWEMLGSLLIFGFCGGMMLLQAYGHFVVIGYGALLEYAGLVAGFVWLFKALWRLLTGKTTGPVDNV